MRAMQYYLRNKWRCFPTR